MPPGKMAAQSGHAFVEAYLASEPQRALAYRDPIGTKVVCTGSLFRILKAEAECERLGVPHALIEDSGHVMPPHFTGEPIVTALGIGLHPEAERVARRFNLYRDAS